MALNSQDARGFESRVVAYYARAETYLIELIADAIRRTGDAPNWAEALLVDVRRMRGAVEGMNTAVWEKTPGEMMQSVDEAYTRGVIHGRADVQDAVPTPPPVQPINHAAVVSLASEGAKSLFPVHQHLYRRVDDAVRTIIHEASGLTVVGAKTPQEAMRQALNGMAKRGMGFYRDTSGRKWALDAYAEMATRTTTTNALRAGYTDSLVDAGFDLVVVSSHKNPAPQCAPFERKVLSLTGKYSAGTHRVGDSIVHVKATMRDAEASGLHHPHCRHTTSLYQAGVTPLKPPEPDPGHVGYQATQKQRYLERQIRASKCLEAAAVTEDDARKARERLRVYQQKLRAHVDEHGLPRRRHREVLRVPVD